MCTLAAIIIMLTTPADNHSQKESNKIINSLNIETIKVASPFPSDSTYVKIPTKILKISKNSK